MKYSISKEDRYANIQPAEENLTAAFAPALKTEFVLFGYNGKLNIDVTGKSIHTVFYEYNQGHSLETILNHYNTYNRKK
mgnify:CR=1 FL=1